MNNKYYCSLNNPHKVEKQEYIFHLNLFSVFSRYLKVLLNYQIITLERQAMSVINNSPHSFCHNMKRPQMTVTVREIM